MKSTDSVLSKLLEGAEKLPAVPAVAAEVLRISQRDDCSIDSLVRVISLDPSLSTRLLKMANSSFAGGRSPVTRLDRAAMLLGMRTVKLMALSCSMAAAFPREGGGVLDLRELWRRSIVRAAAARGLALQVKSPLADEAFLCGLLSHVGRLVLCRSFPRRYAEVVKHAGRPWPLPEHERRIFGFDGAAAGASLLRHWSLPALLCDAIGCAAEPEQASLRSDPQKQELTRLLHLAAWCEELICGDDAPAAMERLESLALEGFKIDSEALRVLLLELETAIAETADALELRMGSVRMQEVLEQAQSEIVRESLGLAVEVNQLHEYAENLARENQDLIARATTDALTGIPNRASFDAFLERCMDRAALADRPMPFGVLVIDIDHFKRFNDTYGHQVGDEVLKLVARSLRGVMRLPEIAARYGGEEFAAALQSTRQGLEVTAERMRAAVESAVLPAAGKQLSVTVSVGGACVDDLRGFDAARLVEQADRCLYAAKRAGRNRWVVESAAKA